MGAARSPRPSACAPGCRACCGDRAGEVALGPRHPRPGRPAACPRSTCAAPAAGGDHRRRVPHACAASSTAWPRTGVEVVRVPAAPVETLAERLAAAVDDRTARGAGLGGAVRDGRASSPASAALAAACRAPRRRAAGRRLPRARAPCRSRSHERPRRRLGRRRRLQVPASSARATASCACRRGATLRPVVTGWFAEFDDLADAHRPGPGRLRPDGAAALRRRHLRPHQPLPGGAGVRLLRRAAGSRPSCCAR